MKLKSLIPSWLIREQPAAVDEPETRTPLEIAHAALPMAEQRYQEALADAATADSRVAAARAQFRRERTEAAKEAWEAAETDVERIRKDVEIVREDVEEARAAVSDSTRAELLARRDRLSQQLTATAIIAAGADDARAEAEAIVALAAVRQKRLEQRAKVFATARELLGVEIALGEHAPFAEERERLPVVVVARDRMNEILTADGISLESNYAKCALSGSGAFTENFDREASDGSCRYRIAAEGRTVYRERSAHTAATSAAGQDYGDLVAAEFDRLTGRASGVPTCAVPEPQVAEARTSGGPDMGDLVVIELEKQKAAGLRW